MIYIRSDHQIIHKKKQETIVHWSTSNAITALVVYGLIKLTSFLSEATPKNQSPVLFFTFSTPMNQSTQSASRAPTSLTTWNSFLHLPSRLRQVEPEWSHNLQRASCCRALPGSPDDSMGCPPESEFQMKVFFSLKVYPHLQVDGGVGFVGSDLVVNDGQPLPSLVQFQSFTDIHLKSKTVPGSVLFANQPL